MKRTGYLYGLIGGLAVCLLAVLVTGGFRRPADPGTSPVPSGDPETVSRVGGSSLHPGAVKVVELSSSPALPASQSRPSANDDSLKAEAKREKRSRRRRRRARNSDALKAASAVKPKPVAPPTVAPPSEAPPANTDVSPISAPDTSKTPSEDTHASKDNGPAFSDSGDAPRKRKERKEPVPPKPADTGTDHGSDSPPPPDGEEIITPNSDG